MVVPTVLATTACSTSRRSREGLAAPCPGVVMRSSSSVLRPAEHRARLSPGSPRVVAGLARADLPLEGPHVQGVRTLGTQDLSHRAHARLAPGLHAPALEPLVVF